MIKPTARLTGVVASQMAVWPTWGDQYGETINSDLDKAIEKNLDAALSQNSLHHDVKYEVTNGAVTSQEKRNTAEMTTSRVP